MPEASQEPGRQQQAQEVVKSLQTGQVHDVVERLRDGELNPQLATTDQLFAFAKRCVDNSYFDGRSEVYSMIASHPDATTEDRARVEINNLDQQRRKNTEEDALQVLTAIREMASFTDPVVEAERLQVQTMANMIMVNGEHQEYRAAAVEGARAILSLSETPDFPTDKRIFYLQSFVAVKISCGQSDEAALAAFDELEVQTFKDNDPSTEEGARSISQFYAQRAQVHEDSGDLDAAVKDNYKSYEIGRGAHYQVGGASRVVQLLAEAHPSSLGGMSFKEEGVALHQYVSRTFHSASDETTYPALKEAFERSEKAYNSVETE